MPQAPDASFAPDVDIDDSKKWILKLDSIVEQPSKYRDKNKNAMTLIHHWLIYDVETGVAVEDNTTGDLFELWQFTNDQTYDNPTSGKIAPAREIANALIGHRLSDDEIRDMLSDWEGALKNKSVLADLEWYSTPEGNQRLRVLRVKPYVKPRREKAVAAPRRTLDDDDDELPQVPF